MSEPNRWYPTPMGNPKLDDALRIIYDHFYSMSPQSGAASDPVPTGMSVTVTFAAPGFKVGATTYHSMTFQGGRLVAVS